MRTDGNTISSRLVSSRPRLSRFFGSYPASRPLSSFVLAALGCDLDPHTFRIIHFFSITVGVCVAYFELGTRSEEATQPLLGPNLDRLIAPIDSRGSRTRTSEHK